MSAYRPEQRTTTVESAVADAYSELAELAGEMRERADNTPEGLQNGETYSTVDSTASELENHTDAPDVPECVSDLAVTYTEMVQRRRGRGTSRATRCANACAMLSAAADALDGFMTKLQEDHQDDPDLGEEDQTKHDETEELRDAVQEVVDACDSLEFPGMRG